MEYVTAGDSHGEALLVIVNDVPAGLPLAPSLFEAELARRRSGYGRSVRQLQETDTFRIIAGVRDGVSTGAPLAFEVDNSCTVSPEACSIPRPGHADLGGMLKTGLRDSVGVSERASARETAARVVAGVVARVFLAAFEVDVCSFTTRIGDCLLPCGSLFEDTSAVAGVSAVAETVADAHARTDTAGPAVPRGFAEPGVGTGIGIPSRAAIESSCLRCPDRETTASMVVAIDAAAAAGDTLGGWFTVYATGLLPGLGGYAQAGDRLTAQLGNALFSIPALRAVSFGLGFEAGIWPGSAVHDEIVGNEGHLGRKSNHAGGLEGGMTTGEPLLISACMKPIPTLGNPLRTVDLANGAPTQAPVSRADVCAVPAAGVIAEAEVALVLASAYQRAFGSACLSDILVCAKAYRDRITSSLRCQV